MLRYILIGLSLLLVGCSAFEGRNSMTLMASPGGFSYPIEQSGPGLAAPTRFTPPNPVAEIRLMSGRPFVPPNTVLKGPSGPTSGSDCLVDFSDHDALALLPDDGTKNTFVHFPWWNQVCSGLNHAVVVPIGADHYNLIYEDPHIGICPNGEYGRLDEKNGTCMAFDPRQEPRSLRSHQPDGTHIFVDNGGSKRPFSLNRIRVEESQAIRLCYKPVQDPTGPWITLQSDGTTHPGIWFCWSALSTGYWDLSDWANLVTEVKIWASEKSGVPYQIDDIHLGL